MVADMCTGGMDSIESKSDSNSKKREPCKLLCLNAQGLINKHTKWKVDAIKEYVNANNVILMNFTETWLKKKYKTKN